MANVNRGEIEVAVDGASVKLVLDFNAICEMEDVSNKTLEEVATDAMAGRMGALRLIFWAAMRRHAPDATLAEAGDLIGAMGIRDASEHLGRLFKASGLADGDDGEADSGNAPAPLKRAARRARIG